MNCCFSDVDPSKTLTHASKLAVPRHVLRVASQVVEEIDDGVGRSVATRVAAGRRDAVQRPLLQGEVGVQVPSLSTSGETLTIEESMTLRARTENAGMLETSTNGAGER